MGKKNFLLQENFHVLQDCIWEDEERKKKKNTVKGDFLRYLKYKIVVQGMQNQFLMLKLGWQTLWKRQKKI